MPMNPRKLVPTQEPGILDFAPGAAAAYSLRNLSLSYASPVVTVRRSTDSAERDFTATEVSDGTLAGWAGADGFVKQWWDQSGNARHATQATAGYQPQIVDSGVLVTEGGKAALRFDGSDDRLDLAAISALPSQSVLSAFFVASPLQFSGVSPGSANARFFDVVASASSFQLLRNSTTQELCMKNLAWQAASASSGFGQAITGLQHYSALFLSSSNLLSIDGASQAVTSSPSAGAVGTVGKIGARADGVESAFFDGYFSEIVFYFSDMAALQDRITGNQMWYY